MRSGTLRHEVTIQSLVPVQDAATGNITDTWTLFATVRAEVRAATLREFIAAGAEQAQLTAVITIRYLEGIKPSMRILHGDHVYNIKSGLFDPKSGREYLVLPCSDIIEG
jgi:SPP1 family predicted phage head-tail adaptor